jgi:hypothetical protein
MDLRTSFPASSVVGAACLRGHRMMGLEELMLYQTRAARRGCTKRGEREATEGDYHVYRDWRRDWRDQSESRS